MELEAFKSEFGHCDVPCVYSANPPLEKMFFKLRTIYKQQQEGTKKQEPSLSQYRKERLEWIGFTWMRVSTR